MGHTDRRAVFQCSDKPSCLSHSAARPSLTSVILFNKMSL